ICQALRWVEEEKLYLKPELFDGQSFPDFKSFFEARFKKPFVLWYELEQTFRFVSKYAPELIDKTFGEARAEAAKRAQEIAKASKATQQPAHRPRKQQQATDLVELANQETSHTNNIGVASSERAKEAERRLRKDRKDLHDRVLAGELSWHAAMVEAGFWK